MYQSSDSATRNRATDRPGDCSPFALGLLTRRAHRHASNALVAALRPHGLELRHFAVLLVLADRGPTLQRDMPTLTGWDKARIGRVVAGLEKAGLVKRVTVLTDRRAWLLEATSLGLAVFDEVHVGAQGIADRLVAHLKPGEPELLMDLLTRYTYPDGDPGLGRGIAIG
ncbi:hypothetical protein K883_05162 [Mycobacterium sp. TKK-01-0059]|uniref:MarR family winged helix-turn-helix transcriptional regulator n=1 Tax=Mycobacterium sp. TKK-01-0059 TaxID=1324269 RepID=UPI0004D8D2D5|nr:MarR family winged helix-turn-helix transcriptional regulator [Mycobacterium sp. TKK-01-0059]KEF94977.1 hypothetical protein K883_05162 [Mycobacterium sp. TKK-01-0059]